VHDVATLIQIAITPVIVTAPIILGVIVLAHGGRDDIGGPLANPAAMPWPRGVQEEDGPRWNVELARPRGSRPALDVQPRPRGTRPVSGCGTVDLPREVARERAGA
jgi:hypothetical protein